MPKTLLPVDPTLTSSGTARAHDPQQLSPWQSFQSLIALGRIPLASESPLWTLLGCLISSQIFPSTTSTTRPTSPFDNLNWWATIQCVLITWGTNISINYANEYFDWDLDRPGQITAITRDIQAKKKIVEDEAIREKEGLSLHTKEETEEAVSEINDKIMSSSCRIIHDGTFPPYTALLCAMFFQLALVVLIIVSRITSPSNSGAGSDGTSSPFRGLALQIGIFGIILSQSYIGPPLRLHYHGFGEIVSSIFTSSIATLFGILGHYTATTGRSVSFPELFSSSSASSSSGFHLDSQMWWFFLALYTYEQARIIMMNIPDIEADKRGNKITLTVRVGQLAASQLYVLNNLISIVSFLFVGAGLVQHQGMLSGSQVLDEGVTKAVSRAWIGGLISVAAFALPIMLVVSVSLFHAIKPFKNTGYIPVLPVTELAKVVSIQTLVTPVVLSATVAVAARAGWAAASIKGGA
ncbi:hypothetical protein CI109_100021 [Kwoniella shandongensis]|uniref:Uncharacterized protein n=1 Tax=Kwoniella shandongensis TaxID=1734106 RepID=A0A5M6BS13_9TREE|nr:uncharacterized protein CI109_006006 [Kwoniella shandongensis]KAA5525698.1 hypothetical protein CI109_006006 [Kwoniella shandongensis]